MNKKRNEKKDKNDSYPNKGTLLFNQSQIQLKYAKLFLKNAMTTNTIKPSDPMYISTSNV